MMKHLEEKTLAKKKLYDGKVIDLYLEDVELPNGKTSKREIVKHPGAVAVLAAVYPVSSSSSLNAVCSGSSPFSSFPAGISTIVRSSGFLNWFTKMIFPSSVTASTATAPGCLTISRLLVFPFGSSTSSK